ncbi:SanA/YdcF family protein [Flavobacterium okayamense]|uniref:DUF218 domain-containing protein n=1 Tax=Flavobacterium okayamense TaxID=2830782 RepID=A0ABM7S791_9FLAO|nr:ElyC/SanA/YdcF family protein [Flavobacterium okayamense]BCY29393.1 hypothetical protein KK2020170_22610 [Flavobacterium okayamense]
MLFKKHIYIIYIGFWCLLPIVIVSFFCNTIVLENSKNKSFSDASKISHNKVGLVLGTSKYLKNGKLNPYFTCRIKATQKLYNANKISFILVSGDNSQIDYNEPLDFKKELVLLGIPENKIILDYAGFRTLDSVVRANKIFNLNSFTIISQPFHTRRALFISNVNNLNAIAFNAEEIEGTANIFSSIREYFARTKVLLDFLFGIEPKFLGEKILIK